MIAILDERTPRAAIEELHRQGIETVLLPPAKNLPAPVASHPDMLIFPAAKEILCTKGYFEVAREALTEISHRANRPLRLIDEEYKEQYPADVPLNALVHGGYLFFHPTATAKAISEATDAIPLPVRQGYVKCSTLPVGVNALISADPSILSAARRAGLSVLEIPHGEIRLDGYGYGFIGGCASYAPYGGTDTVYFCGALSKHPMGREIEEFRVLGLLQSVKSPRA